MRAGQKVPLTFARLASVSQPIAELVAGSVASADGRLNIVIFGTYRDPEWLKRTMTIVAAVIVLLALTVLAVGFIPGFAGILLVFCAVSTVATLLLWKLFD